MSLVLSSHGCFVDASSFPPGYLLQSPMLAGAQPCLEIWLRALIILPGLSAPETRIVYDAPVLVADVPEDYGEEEEEEEE